MGGGGEWEEGGSGRRGGEWRSLSLVFENSIQCTSDIVATLGHPFLDTLSDWPLYPT